MIEEFKTAKNHIKDPAPSSEAEVHHTNNPVTEPPAIEKKYLSSIIAYIQKDTSFFFHDGNATVEIKVVSDDVIRVRMAPSSTFLADFSYAVVPSDQHADFFRLEEDEESYQVKTSSVSCVLRKHDFLISFVGASGKSMAADDAPMHWEENADFGGYYVYCSKRALNGESYFGLGDKPTNLNLREKRLKNWNSDTYSFSMNQDPLYKSIPFYIGLHEGEAYGLFFDNTFKTFFDFAAEDPSHTSFWSEGGELQYYYIHGPQMMDVVQRYHSLTGTHSLPPTWALGYHQCRWSYYPESKLKSLAKEFRTRKIPCDALYLDIDYMEGYRCFTWNKSYFPDPKRMIHELANEGFKTVVMIDPGIKVDENYWVFKEGKKNNYFCRRGDDYFMEGHVWPGRCQFPDFTSRAVRAWWADLYKGLVDVGVAGVWNDMNEPAVFGKGTFPDDVRHNFDGYRGSHRKAHNVYGMQMVRATYEGLKKLNPAKRPFTITRAAYAGTQRYASVWTGDNVATWEHLRLGSLQLQRLAMSGLSFCGTDIGGFSGEPSGELFTRWIQFGVFSPFMRAHSAGDTAEREPWSFGEDFEAINRKFIELRYRLLPYIYTAFWELYRYGLPVLRPVVMLEQEVAGNAYREEEFAFGGKILVSPVIVEGQREKTIYLPRGYWYDFWNGKPLEGGKERQVKTPLDEMPIFVKAGAVIADYPVMQHVNEKVVEVMDLKVYYIDGEEETLLYEDEGESFDFEDEVFKEKRFTLRGTSTGLEIALQETGTYAESYQEYRLHLIGLPFEPKQATVDNEATPIAPMPDGSYRIQVNKRFKNISIR